MVFIAIQKSLSVSYYFIISEQVIHIQSCYHWEPNSNMDFQWKKNYLLS